MVRQIAWIEEKRLYDERRGCGRRAAHRSAVRTATGSGTGAFVPGVRRIPLSELNRSPALGARESGGAPAALAPVRECVALPASVGPVSRSHRPHPAPVREKRTAASLEHIAFVRKTERNAR